ncbi:MAG: molybdenum ABC transporter ATP-binding protein [Panacagrimonas sp.]
MDQRIRAHWQLKRQGFELDVNLELPGAGVTGLYGPSGSGKTTCLRAFAGLERIEGGYLSVNQTVWQDADAGRFVKPQRRGLAYVPQEPSLFAHMNVRANLEYGWRRAKRPDAVNYDEIIGLLGLESFLERRPEQLSGGEKQRVAIARALLSGPELLLFDEPLSALDAARKSEFLPYLDKLHDTLSVPTIYVSHSIEEMRRIADYLVLIRDGRVQAQGPIQDILPRLDLAASFSRDPSVVFESRIMAHDASDYLTQLSFSGGILWVPMRAEAVGRSLRCEIHARDVSLSLEQPQASSVLNRVPVKVVGIGATEPAGQMLVRLDAGGTALLSRVTQRSCRSLNLRPGLELWAQIKAAALID